MSSQGEPGVTGHACVAITAKQCKKASFKCAGVEFHALRKGETMVVMARAGQIVELKVLVFGTKGAHPTKLSLQVSPEPPSPLYPDTGSGPGNRNGNGTHG